MTDVLSRVTLLRRPRILSRAAHHGMRSYNRNRDLTRILRMAAVPSPLAALGKLMFEEESMEQKRKAGDASYSIARHVELLIALLSETGLAQAAQKETPARQPIT